MSKMLRHALSEQGNNWALEMETVEIAQAHLDNISALQARLEGKKITKELALEAEQLIGGDWHSQYRRTAGNEVALEALTLSVGAALVALVAALIAMIAAFLKWMFGGSSSGSSGGGGSNYSTIAKSSESAADAARRVEQTIREAEINKVATAKMMVKERTSFFQAEYTRVMLHNKGYCFIKNANYGKSLIKAVNELSFQKRNAEQYKAEYDKYSAILHDMFMTAKRIDEDAYRYNNTSDKGKFEDLRENINHRRGVLFDELKHGQIRQLLRFTPESAEDSKGGGSETRIRANELNFFMKSDEKPLVGAHFHDLSSALQQITTTLIDLSRYTTHLDLPKYYREVDDVKDDLEQLKRNIEGFHDLLLNMHRVDSITFAEHNVSSKQPGAFPTDAMRRVLDEVKLQMSGFRGWVSGYIAYLAAIKQGTQHLVNTQKALINLGEDIIVSYNRVLREAPEACNKSSYEHATQDYRKYAAEVRRM